MGKYISRILIVDDNKDIHEDIKQILNPIGISSQDTELQLLKNDLFGEENEGPGNDKDPLVINYHIDDAFGGESAVQMILQADAENYPYALVFMDVRMPPGMDGIQTVEKIWELNPFIEVVICTAYSDYSWDQILLNFGQTDHLLFMKKPLDSVSLKQVALALTTKWNLERLNRSHIDNLETEVKKRTRELNDLVEKLKAEIDLRKEKEEQLAHIAHFDPLTNLLNRNSYYQYIARIIENKSDIEKLYFFYIDIDGFKQVNDLLGHDTGDLLLQQISQRIKLALTTHACLITNITGYEDKNKPAQQAIFRLGGDEFIAILASEEQSDIEKIAGELCKKIKETYIISGQRIDISGSIGISIYPGDTEDANLLLKYADLAMYRAKELRGTYLFFDKIKDTIFIQQLALENELKAALAREEIGLEYQSLLNNQDQLIGIEALIRWRHPTLGIQKPEDIIYIAEKTGLTIKIGEFILKTACKHLKKLHTAGFENLFVLVNCTMKQFYDANFINTIHNALTEADLQPDYLRLGLEERFSMQDPERSLGIISKLNKIGVHFTIDGLGKGQSLFNFLLTLPKHTTIKIDKAYVENITNNTEDKNFLFIMLDLLKSRCLDAIVSGIETREQKELLSTKDCILQGFYFNKPQAFEDFIRHISPKPRAN